MPPHCDSLDGPVVTAARRALDAGDVELVLPYVSAAAEAEVRAAFDRVLPLHDAGPQAWETARLWFFETVVRLHRAGEGAAYTGLKPAGLPVGPVLPLAERAVEEGRTDVLADFLAGVLRTELKRRLGVVAGLEAHRKDSLEDERRYVAAVLGFEVYSHGLYRAMRASGEHQAGAGHAG
jgi:hypothetical protein